MLGQSFFLSGHGFFPKNSARRQLRFPTKEAFKGGKLPAPGKSRPKPPLRCPQKGD
jgi:hypothetical protein